jgi:AcrR family transcriptional regulator
MTRGETKQHILRTAVQLFNDRGTAAVSTNHIAESAGISPGNLYYHYRNKEEIIRAIFDLLMTEWGQLYTLPQDQSIPLSELRNMLGDTFSVMWEYRFFYREFAALIRHDPELGARYRVIREHGLANTGAILRSFIDAGVLTQPRNPATLPQLTTILWLITEFWLPFTEMGEENVGPERLREGVELMLQVLKPYMTGKSIGEPSPNSSSHHIPEEQS